MKHQWTAKLRERILAHMVHTAYDPRPELQTVEAEASGR